MDHATGTTTPVMRQQSSNLKRVNRRNRASVDKTPPKLGFHNSSRSLTWLPTPKHLHLQSTSAVLIRSEEGSQLTHSLHILAKTENSQQEPDFASCHAISETRRREDVPSTVGGRPEKPTGLRKKRTACVNDYPRDAIYQRANIANPAPSPPSSTDIVVTAIDDHSLVPRTAPALQEFDQSWRESIQDLVRETEEAFKAVGDSLEDGDATSTSWLSDLAETSIPSPMSAVSTISSSSDVVTLNTTNDVSQKHGRQEAVELTHKPLPPCPNEMRDVRPVVTEVKKDSRKSGKPRSSGTKWAVPHGVTQILSVSRLRRAQKPKANTEACKRPPSQSLKFIKKREKAQSGASPTVENPASKPSISPLQHAVAHDGFALQVQFEGRATIAETSAGEADGTDPPCFTKSVSEQIVVAPRKRRLPTIHEANAIHGQEATERRSEESSDRSGDHGDVVYLPGTSVSVANSTFRHGRIACQRMLPDPCTEDEEEDEEDPIDSCAYQIATLCGAGDLAIDTDADIEHDMADDMAEWFEEFGFASHGQLIPASASQRSPCADGSEASLANPARASVAPMRFFESRRPPKDWTPEGSKRYNLRQVYERSCGRRTPSCVV
ncbi:hypothetical protein AAL_01821 [Moelleriella libera RCEF 2490]|uniref:Uncharacterized protein n=1 Tax=Moelleriella libera RCEF 2490 TaxID=1081109 RepID=A0A166UGZ7_9HYPO|nr:hypothetical protein AAL_01821 [Moelleriella libera RCEF 2490]